MRYDRAVTLASIVILAAWAATCKTDSSGPPAGGPPTVDAGVDMRTQPGATVPFTARIVTPGAPSAYRWTLAWGDGKADSGTVGSTGMITATHSYASVGQYPLRLTARGPAAADTGSDGETVYVEPAGTPQVFIGAGDIGECGSPWPPKTAQVIDTTPGTVFTLGDNAYDSATAREFANCYQPTWGKFKKRTYPTPGNHEFQEYFHDTVGAGYFGYFGVVAHDQPRGWYSYDLGAWHIVVLNSSFEISDPAGRNIPLATQLSWLQADLAAHPVTCTLAMWHHPRFSSGTVHGNDTLVQPFWQVLYDAGADVVLVGHEHNYERFAPQTPTGTLDNARGIREFVVGTGGGGFDALDTTKVGQTGNSQVGGIDHGVLKLTLSPGTYHWEFIPVGFTLSSPPSQYSHTDSGTASCH